MTADTPHSNTPSIATVSSGISELDYLLNGGYVEGRTYLIQGVSGTGKSMLGQHFLAEGIENGETVVYIHGEESEADIITNAAQVAIDVRDAEFLDIGPGTDFFTEDISYELVETAEVESERFTKDIKEVIETVSPERLLIDPLTQLQYIEKDEYQYRKRIQSLIRFVRDQGITTIATRTVGHSPQGEFTYHEFESLSDGVIKLSLQNGERRISVPKHRGLGQVDGTHGLEIREQGIEVYPQTVLDGSGQTFNPSLLSTGDAALDSLLGSGIEQSAVSFISGPTGIGKSTVGVQMLSGIAENGGTVLAYLFEESVEQFTYRCESLGVPITELRESGTLQLTEIEPLVQSAEEFGQQVVNETEAHSPDAVLIDGLAGYKLSLQGDEERLVRRLHGLTRTLKSHGVAVIITDATDQLTGFPKATSTNASYLADSIVFLTYVEVDGELQRAIGVLKKRLGDFDKRFHKFSIESDSGIQIGEPFSALEGIMTGRPTKADRG